MSSETVFTFPVPDGYPAMSLPVEASARFPPSKVIISPLEEKDLLEAAHGTYTSFAAVWWSKYEPDQPPLPLSVRAPRFAKRMAPMLSQPGVHALKATLRDDPTGRIAGVAVWYHSADFAPGVENMLKRSAVERMGLAERQGWSAAELDDMWAHVDIPGWDGTLEKNDRVRAEVMGGRAHWYLAPLWVLEEYRGHGIASLLMRWAMDRADAHDPPLPLYLEAMPNARPTYMHMGFESKDGSAVMIRWPRPAKVS